MAGHSHFKNVMRRKGAQDAKKAKVLTKVQREIISACKSGMPDPNSNPRLRAAIQWAREENMPRDRIEAAVKRGSGNIDTDNYETMRYEGYGPGGTALIVQALTDNRNRTASDIRSAFTKFGGNLGESGRVSFMFDYVGRIMYPAAAASEDAMFEAALDAGADNCESDGRGPRHHLFAPKASSPCARAGEKIRRARLRQAYMAAEKHRHRQRRAGQKLLKLIDMLEDNDDVQDVFSNFEIPEALMEKLSA